jgi:hypothetical protein
MPDKAETDGAIQAHYARTAGGMTARLERLATFDPGYFENYSRIRMLAYGMDRSSLTPATIELLFVMLAAVHGNPGGARTHLRAGARSGLQLADVHQMLLLVLFELGASAWVSGVSEVWDIALEELGAQGEAAPGTSQDPRRGP